MNLYQKRTGWNPGDLAYINDNWPEDILVMAVRREVPPYGDEGVIVLSWKDLEGEYHGMCSEVPARPVKILDPEDHELMRRLEIEILKGGSLGDKDFLGESTYYAVKRILNGFAG